MAVSVGPDIVVLPLIVPLGGEIEREAVPNDAVTVVIVCESDNGAADSTKNRHATATTTMQLHIVE